MLLLLQLSLLCCSIAITSLNERSFKTPSFTLFQHSGKFGTYYRKSLLAFYIMSSLLSIAGFYVPFSVKGIYYDGNDVIDIIQRTHRCCGPDGPFYWSKNTAWANRELAQYKYKVPKSCCNRKRCTLASMKFKELTIHKDSCQQHFVYSFESFLSYNWKFPFAICIIQSLIIVLCVIIVKLQKIGFLSKDVDEDGEKRTMLFSKDLLRLSGLRENDKIHASQFWISKEEDAKKDGRTTKQERLHGKNRIQKRKLGLLEDNNKISNTPLYRDNNERSYIEENREKYEHVVPSRRSSFSKKSSYTDDYSIQRPSRSFYSPRILDSPPTSHRKIPRSHHSSRIRSQPSRPYYNEEEDDFRRKRRNSSDEDDKFKRRRRRNRSKRHLDNNDDLDRSYSNGGRRSKILSTLDELFRPKIVVDQRRKMVDSDEEMDKTLDKIDDLELDLRWQKLETLRRKKKRGLKKLEMLAKKEDMENRKLEELMR
ncbi:hypothetical protein HELRODRAFT_182051 [Helobdella robusta]|uniref:Tetraspanin n=1 Tax=Helobdella robusta TaxID=6412 RepID=T1FHN5_HELRO|nr:hypothetical protein HELRODRAFT_182051 [Helobdella robusta]ESN91873.1 hypothetical protein HELRODRAFT_182051 [Helobdella robusta]